MAGAERKKSKALDNCCRTIDFQLFSGIFLQTMSVALQ
jgi:hypothetical protein